MGARRGVSKPRLPSLCHLLFPNKPSQRLTAPGLVVSLFPSSSASLSTSAAGRKGQSPHPPGRVTGPKLGRELEKGWSPRGTRVPTRESWRHCLFPHPSHTHHPCKTYPVLEKENGVTVTCSPKAPTQSPPSVFKCPGIIPHGMPETTHPSWKRTILLDILLSKSAFCGVTCHVPGDNFFLKCIYLLGNLVLVAACGIYFPDQESNSGPLHWELRVLAPEPPGKSLQVTFFF